MSCSRCPRSTGRRCHHTRPFPRFQKALVARDAACGLGDNLRAKQCRVWAMEQRRVPQHRGRGPVVFFLSRVPQSSTMLTFYTERKGVGCGRMGFHSRHPRSTRDDMLPQRQLKSLLNPRSSTGKTRFLQTEGGGRIGVLDIHNVSTFKFCNLIPLANKFKNSLQWACGDRSLQLPSLQRNNIH
jgi:hypothetical protein